MRFRISELRQLISEAIGRAYELLGVSPATGADEIKKAYRMKALQLHPDKNPGKDVASDMVQLNVAYGLLSDPEKRRRYDQIGDRTLGDTPGQNPSSRPTPGSSSSYSSAPPPRPPNAVQPRTIPGEKAQLGDVLWIKWGDEIVVATLKRYHTHGFLAHIDSMVGDVYVTRWMIQQGYEAKTGRKTSQQPGQRPPNPASGTIPNKFRYFTYVRGRSQKFWWCRRAGSIVSVGFGRIGTAGQTKTYPFKSEFLAVDFSRRKIDEKLKKGYVEQAAPPGVERDSQRSAAPQPPLKKEPCAVCGGRGPHTPSTGHEYVPRSKAPSGTASQPAPTSGTKTYKIYGRKGKAPAHTRYQGKVYGAPSDTRFKNGDRADVAMGSDGRLSVHDRDTGHTQHWQSEAIQRLVDDLVLDGIFGCPNDTDFV